ncbi:MAG TPA: hypothetical protein VFI72_13650 [Candidatus Angelobacter sp.]|nr:hypothetical protein [Candidatus Angelobacter sp.]
MPPTLARVLPLREENHAPVFPATQSVYFGANLYYWGSAEQDSLLARGVRTWEREAKQRELAQGLWYLRFDTRGPHVFLLFTTTREKESELQTFLETQIANFLCKEPSRHVLGQEEIEKRHRDCRGKLFNAGDFEPGFAANNSVVTFRHGADQYPFQLFQRLNQSDDLWRRVNEIALWAIDHLGAGATTAAIEWIAAVDEALRSGGFPGEAYWRFHASTLLLPLQARLAANEAEVLEMVPRLVSDNNRNVFSQVWERAANGDKVNVDVAGLVSLIMSDSCPLEDRLRILREVNHTVLAQLGQWVKFHIPLVVYAWSRNLPR